MPPPTVVPAWGTGQVLAGRFELRRTVGVGGCGTVFEAWDRVLRREVAIKVPHWSLFEKKSVRQRFAIEARAAARLSHANIVPVYEARIEEAGECFLISEFVRGPSLEAWLDEHAVRGRAVPIRQAAQIIADLATGVDFAHTAGVLHRDLKPSNVLLALATEGDLPIVPRITDFGLARLSEATSVSTVEGSIFGSLPYMAPEQAAGAKDIGPASDIYSLGVILYELLTGTLPIMAETASALLTAISTQSVEPLRRRRVDVPADLEAVCLKCLEKRPRDRYRTAAELAVDLRRFLAGEAVSARLPGRRERLVRWVRRHPATTMVLSTLAVAVLAVVGVLIDANHTQDELIEDLRLADRGLKTANAQLATSNDRLNTALQTAGEMRRKADLMRRQAETQQKKTQESLYVSEFRRAIKAWEDQDLPLLQIVLDKLDQPEFAPYRGVECDWLRTKLIRPHRELLRFPRAAYTLAFSQDGTTLAAGGRDSTVKLVRYADAAPLAEWQTQQKEINGLAFAGDSQRLWTSGDDGSLCQWDVATRKELLRIPAHAPEQAHDLLLAPKQNLLLSLGTDGRILLWDPLTGERRGELPGDGKTMIAAELHPDGRHLYSMTSEQICRWDLETRSLVSTWETRDHRPIALMISGDGRWLLLSKNNATLDMRDAESGAIAISQKSSDNIHQLVLFNDTGSFAAVDGQGALHEHSLPRSSAEPEAGPALRLGLRSRSRLVAGRIMRAVPSPASDHIVTANADGRVLAWPRATLDPRRPVTFRTNGVTDSALSADGRTFFLLEGHTFRLLDSETLTPQTQVDTSPRRVSSFCVLRNGDLFTAEYTATDERALVRRRAGTWQSIAECPMPPHPGGFGTLHYDSTLDLVVTYESRPPFAVRRVVGLEPLQEWQPMRFPATSGRFALDSRYSRHAFDIEQLLVVRETTSREILWTQPHPGGVRSLTVSPDGRYFASASDDRVIHVWDAGSGRLISELAGHRHQVGHLQMTSDGRTLLSSDDGGEIRIWHTATGDLLGHIDRPSEAAIVGLKLSPNDDRLMVVRVDAIVESVPLKPRGPD